jgi:ArsR family transcriptional regulator, arsenate/arsenite/antimonite-responsive transcriptional repressor
LIKSDNQDFEEIADIAKALSHPARIKIIQILAEKKMCVCGEIVDLLPLSQSTVSQHLKELKRVGLIKGEIEGPKTCYCINEEKLARAFSKMSRLFNKVFNCC